MAHVMTADGGGGGGSSSLSAEVRSYYNDKGLQEYIDGANNLYYLSQANVLKTGEVETAINGLTKVVTSLSETTNNLNKSSKTAYAAFTYNGINDLESQITTTNTNVESLSDAIETFKKNVSKLADDAQSEDEKRLADLERYINKYSSAREKMKAEAIKDMQKRCLEAYNAALNSKSATRPTREVTTTDADGNETTTTESYGLSPRQEYENEYKKYTVPGGNFIEWQQRCRRFGIKPAPVIPSIGAVKKEFNWYKNGWVNDEGNNEAYAISYGTYDNLSSQKSSASSNDNKYRSGMMKSNKGAEGGNNDILTREQFNKEKRLNPDDFPYETYDDYLIAMSAKKHTDTGTGSKSTSSLANKNIDDKKTDQDTISAEEPVSTNVSSDNNISKSFDSNKVSGQNYLIDGKNKYGKYIGTVTLAGGSMYHLYDSKGILYYQDKNGDIGKVGHSNYYKTPGYENLDIKSETKVSHIDSNNLTARLNKNESLYINGEKVSKDDSNFTYATNYKSTTDGQQKTAIINGEEVKVSDKYVGGTTISAPNENATVVVSPVEQQLSKLDTKQDIVIGTDTYKYGEGGKYYRHWQHKRFTGEVIKGVDEAHPISYSDMKQKIIDEYGD